MLVSLVPRIFHIKNFCRFFLANIKDAFPRCSYPSLHNFTFYYIGKFILPCEGRNPDGGSRTNAGVKNVGVDNAGALKY